MADERKRVEELHEPARAELLFFFSFFETKVLFSYARKLFKIEYLHIWSIKYRLITKLITELVCKLGDKSNESN